MSWTRVSHSSLCSTCSPVHDQQRPAEAKRSRIRCGRSELVQPIRCRTRLTPTTDSDLGWECYLRSGALRSYVLGVNRQLGGAITAWPFSFVSQCLCAYFSVAVLDRINDLRPTPTTSGSCVDTLCILEFDEA